MLVSQRLKCVERSWQWKARPIIFSVLLSRHSTSIALDSRDDKDKNIANLGALGGVKKKRFAISWHTVHAERAIFRLSRHVIATIFLLVFMCIYGSCFESNTYKSTCLLHWRVVRIFFFLINFLFVYFFDAIVLWHRHAPTGLVLKIQTARS